MPSWLQVQLFAINCCIITLCLSQQGGKAARQLAYQVPLLFVRQLFPLLAAFQKLITKVINLELTASPCLHEAVDKAWNFTLVLT
jgi:hypothetical protein